MLNHVKSSLIHTCDLHSGKWKNKEETENNVQNPKELFDYMLSDDGIMDDRGRSMHVEGSRIRSYAEVRSRSRIRRTEEQINNK